MTTSVDASMPASTAGEDTMVEIKLVPPDRRLEYVLATLFTAVGFPFRVVAEWGAPAVRVLCARRPIERADLFIPAPADATAGSALLRIVMVDDMPVVSAGDPPRNLIEGTTLGFDLLNSVLMLLSPGDQAPSASVEHRRHWSPVPLLRSHGLLERPVVGRYVKLLREHISAALTERGKSSNPVPLWPGGEGLAVGLSHDVDHIMVKSPQHSWALVRRGMGRQLVKQGRLQCVLRGCRSLLSASAGRIISSIDAGEWMDLEESMGVRSTFFFAAATRRTAYDPFYGPEATVRVGSQMLPLREALPTLREGGWEIGLHGSVRSHTDHSMLLREKECLQRLAGSSVSGVRQHRLLFSSTDTWEAQTRAGFAYDSTIGFNDAIGYSSGMSLPFHPYSARGGCALDLLEIPLAIQDSGLYHLAGGDPEVAVERAWSLVQSMQETGGLLTLSWHFGTIDSRLHPKRLVAYRELVARLKTQGAYIDTLGGIARWWRAREEMVNRTSHALRTGLGAARFGSTNEGDDHRN